MIPLLAFKSPLIVKIVLLQALSVIAHQIQSIQRAIQARLSSMLFEDSDIKIDPGCAILVTTESLQTESKHLPDNLKVTTNLEFGFRNVFSVQEK